MIRFLLVGLLWAEPAVADDVPGTFGLPVGCTAYITVQTKQCQVRHYFRCENDPVGHQRAANIRESGNASFSEIDIETQWISSFSAQSGEVEELSPNTRDGASFSTLTRTGLDEYDFNILLQDGREVRHVGSDQLTGRTLTIDDVVLEETELAYTRYHPDGSVLDEFEGNEFIHREWGRFLPGTVTRTDVNGVTTSDNPPVEFIFPGERGFLSTRPKYGCGVAISSAETFEENTHDNL